MFAVHGDLNTPIVATTSSECLTLLVQVPESHRADGRAPDLGNTTALTQPQLTVLSGQHLPSIASELARLESAKAFGANVDQINALTDRLSTGIQR